MKFFGIILFLAQVAIAPACGQTSAAQQGPIAALAPTTAVPTWGKLVMTGNTVTCYYALGAATPTTWTQVGQGQSIGFLNNPVLVGLFICSHKAGVMSSGTIDNVTMKPAPKYKLQDVDIGAPTLMGAANLINGVWNVMGSGVDVWGTSDQCNFQPWLVWGDCTIVCRVTSISTGDPWQKIGIMIRDGYNSGSDFASFCATNGSGVAFQYRLNFHVNSDGTSAVTLVAPPVNSNASASVALGVSPIGTNSNYFVIRP